jgi:2'-5' RNA ligase
MPDLYAIGAFERARIAGLARAQRPSRPPEHLRADQPRCGAAGSGCSSLCGRRSFHCTPRSAASLREGIALDPRPFAPHVTLARRARGGAPPAEAAEVAWEARGFALVESVRAPSADYDVLACFGGGAGLALEAGRVTPA